MALTRNLIRKPVAPVLPHGVIEVPSYPGSTYMHIVPKPGTDPKKLSIEARVAIATRPVDPHLPNFYMRRLLIEQQEQAAAREAARKSESQVRVSALVAKKRAAGEIVDKPGIRAARAAAPATSLRAASVLRTVIGSNTKGLDPVRNVIYMTIGLGGPEGTKASDVRKAMQGKPVLSSIAKLVSLGLIEVISF